MRRMEERKAENYPEYSNLHIDKLQLEALGKSELFDTNDVCEFKE